jgi:hypothetical protein
MVSGKADAAVPEPMPNARLSVADTASVASAAATGLEAYMLEGTRPAQGELCRDEGEPAPLSPI